jgi:ABC-type sugar transport system permease subunit
MVAGCEAIIHLGGVSVERPFEEILEANIKGVFHIYEAARRHGVKRVIFASSNHVTGFYRQDERIDAHDLKRPDGYYGLSKSYGEDMAQFYFDRYGVETVSIRIGSIFPEATNRRMLASWMSMDDFEQLLRRALFIPALVTPWSMACRPMPRPGGTTATPRTWAMRPRTVRRSSAPRWKRNRSRLPMIRWRPCRVVPSRPPVPSIPGELTKLSTAFSRSSRQSRCSPSPQFIECPARAPAPARHGSLTQQLDLNRSKAAPGTPGRPHAAGSRTRRTDVRFPETLMDPAAMNFSLDFSPLAPYWPVFLRGAWLTLKMTTLAVIVGVAIGIFVAFAKNSRNRILARTCSGYIEVVRNTPVPGADLPAVFRPGQPGRPHADLRGGGAGDDHQHRRLCRRDHPRRHRFGPARTDRGRRNAWACRSGASAGT